MLQGANCFAPTDYWSICFAFVADFIFATIGMGKASTSKKKASTREDGEKLGLAWKKASVRRARVRDASELRSAGQVDVATSML